MGFQHTATQYQALIEHSSDIITLVDENGIIQFQSPSVVSTLGYEPKELVGENAFEYVHADDREQVMATFDTVIDSPGDVSDREQFRFRQSDGSWLWLESVVSNQTETTLDGYVINSRDISERKRHEQALAEERDKFETIVSESHDAIFIAKDEVVVFANHRFLDMLGYDEQELIGKHIFDLPAPEDRDLVRERYTARLDPDEESPPPQYEVEFLTKDGSRRVAEISATQIQYQGEPADLVSARDITERKHNETRLQKTTEELEALNRLVRHDIRNDMNVVLGWAQMLEDHVDESGQEYLQRILTSGNHIVELTEIARDYLETLGGGEEMEITPTPLCSILENEIELMRESHPEADFITTKEPPDIAVNANEMLGSVFRNLLNNAIQHNDKDEPLVEISCEPHEDDVLIQIADNGPGIPDDQKESVFGKGHKGIGSEGTGIGLYLVQTLISQYGGRIWIEDNEPTGAIINIQLPRVD
jgi:PAS domain S-box-containing protein